MLNKKVWPFLVIAVLFGVFFWAFTYKDTSAGNNPGRQQQILNQAAALLLNRHYDPKPFNDELSERIFFAYLKQLDADKTIFLQSDIAELNKFKSTIDDELMGAPIQFFPAVEAIFLKRLSEVKQLNKEILKSPFSFTKDEYYEIDENKETYATSAFERKEKIRKRLKYLTLERFVELQNQRDKATDKKEKQKTDVELEAEARKKITAITERFYNRFSKPTSADDRFNAFVNTVAETAGDAHTNYLPPLEKRAFDELMSGNFYGIGAQLREEEGNIKIVSVVPGSPAWKSGKIQANDIILKVAQGKNEPVDLSGYEVEDAVKLIRGDKGTEVRLTIKKSDGTSVMVPLMRDKIVTDDIFARSTVIDRADGKKIGYIFLPEFYANFEDAAGAHCAADVAKEIQKLKAENVDGIILDLRNNGGGSLFEVVEMVGLFIPSGPVVQIKDKTGNPTVLRDEDKGLLYDGPLAVMVNEFSASASEIFAAAIQDYNRGIVVGSSSTYGKGTVQRNFPFGKALDFFSGRTEFGALKITQQKFYRVNGGSTQLKGVTPDVVMPDVLEFAKLREKDNDNALKWDQIKPSAYTPWNNVFNKEEVVRTATLEIRQSPVFDSIRMNTEWLEKNSDKTLALNIVKFKEQQNAIKEKVKSSERLLKLGSPMKMDFMKIDQSRYLTNADTSKVERYKQWLDFARSDIYIKSTSDIIGRMTSSHNKAALRR